MRRISRILLIFAGVGQLTFLNASVGRTEQADGPRMVVTENPFVQSTTNAVASLPTNTTTVVTVAASFESAAEAVSPSDQLAPPVPTPAKPMDSVQSYPMTQNWSSLAIPYAPMPSYSSSMLRYLNCDPHSCPNIWAGYEAQRAYDLSHKCMPHCCHHGCGGAGCGYGCSHLYPSPCLSCGTGCGKLFNRYLAAPIGSNDCASCDAPSCDGGCAVEASLPNDAVAEQAQLARPAVK